MYIVVSYHWIDMNVSNNTAYTVLTRTAICDFSSDGMILVITLKRHKKTIKLFRNVATGS